jgi:hypothetical protein
MDGVAVESRSSGTHLEAPRVGTPVKSSMGEVSTAIQVSWQGDDKDEAREKTQERGRSKSQRSWAERAVCGQLQLRPVMGGYLLRNKCKEVSKLIGSNTAGVRDRER